MKYQDSLKRVLSLVLCLATVLSCSMLLSTTVQAYATQKKSVNVTATKAYTLNLNWSLSVCSFYIGHDYIYVTQHEKDVTYLSRLKINGTTATYQDHMTLKKCGLGETLDMYNYNGKAYFLIGCKSDDVAGNGTSASTFYAAHQIARIEYKAGTTYSTYTSLPRFSKLVLAGSYYDSSNTLKSVNDGDIYRVAAAACGEKMIFRVEVADGDIRYAIYDTAKLNAALDATGTSGLSLGSAAAVKAKIKSFKQDGGSSSTNKVYPNTSFKGIEFSCYRSIYVAGGGADADHPRIARMDYDGTYDLLITITNISKTEIYGLQADAGNIYFRLKPGSNLKSGQTIYYFSENVLGSSCRTTADATNKNHEIRYKESSQSPWNCKTAWTCTSAGWTPYVYCIYCGYQQRTQEYYDSPRGHHTVSIPAVSATCTTYGKEEGSYCDRCSTIITAQRTVAPTGHSYGEGILTQEATCTQKGVISYTCANCSDTYNEELEKLLHIDVDNDGICDSCGCSTDAEPQSILIDYAKTVETNVIEKAIINGISEEHLRSAELVSVSSTPFGALEIFDADDDNTMDSLRFTPTTILSQVITLNCTVCFSDNNGASQTRIIPMNIVPATIMYYETDFSDGVFTLTDTNDGWEERGNTNQNTQDNGDCEDPLSELIYGMQDIPSNAFFADFTGETARYGRDSIYAGKNYDTVAAWGWNQSRTKTPEMDTATGTMTLTQANTSETGIYFQTSPDITADFELNYHPEKGHCTIIRFKLNNLQIADSTKPVTIDTKYYTYSDRSEGIAEDGILDASSYELDPDDLNGEYITVKMPWNLNTSYARAKVSSLRFCLNNVKSLSESQLGNMTVDYIYVGPIQEETAEPTIDHEYYENPAYAATQYLLFDFDNSANARARYNNSNYQNRTNFDTAAHWCYLADNSGQVENTTTAGTKGTVDNVRGTLSVAVVKQQSSHGRYGTYVGPTNGTNQVVNLLDVDGHTFSQSLNYTPTSGAKTYFHIRFKFRNCKKDQLLSIDETAYVQLSLLNGSSAYHKETGTNFVFENDKYIELSGDITSQANSCGTLKSFYIRFCNIIGNSTGYVDIDYIYIGPESDPNKIRSAEERNIMIDFDNGDYDKNRYAGELYGGVNYDAPSAWTSGGGYTHSIANGVLTLTPTDESKNHADGWGWKKTNDDYSSLSYKMSGEDYIVARIKANDITGKNDNVPVVGFYFGQLEKGSTDQYHSGYGYINVDESNGKWATYVLDISSYANKIDTVTFLYPQFENMTYGENATIEIDYIYLGSLKNGTAPADALYFGFGNRLEDQKRYNSITYGNLNFDEEYNLYNQENAETINVSNNLGVLEVMPTAGTTYFAIDTTDASGSFPLCYHPDKAEICQIRFKMENFTAHSAGDPFFCFQYFCDNKTNASSVGDTYFPAKYLSNGEYITLTINLRENAIREVAEIMRVRFLFGHFNSNADSKVTIDYVYLGPGKGVERSGMTYGYDSGYASDQEYSGGSSYFVEGMGIPRFNSDYTINTTATSDYTEAVFTFTGTGFDIIGCTGAQQGLIRAMIYDREGKFVKAAQVLMKSEGNHELYQIPVLSVEMRDQDTQALMHGTYTVKLYVASAYTNASFPALNRGGEFYFDAIRIYNTIDTMASTEDAKVAYETYLDHGEADAVITEVRDILITKEEFSPENTMPGAVYIDKMPAEGQPTVADYASVGPNNETYLASNNAIAFKAEATGDLPASFDIGAKSADGKEVVLNVVVSDTPPEALPPAGGKAIATCSTQYYPIAIDNWVFDETTNKHYVYVVISNNGSGILSITDIKYAYNTAEGTVTGIATETASSTVQRETRSPSSGRYLRFLVDEAMIATYDGCNEHVFAYSNKGENHEAVCTLCGYKENGAHTYSDGSCICGAVESTDPIPNPNLSFTMNISAGAEMTVTYSIMGTAVNSYADFYLEVKKDVAGGDPITTVYGISGDREPMVAKVNPSTGVAMMYQVTYKGINAKEMGDNFSTTLYAVAEDGTVYCGATSVKSIKSYLLEKADAEASIPELKTMAIDMLKYGAAAQVRLGYNTENLVTADLTEEQLSYATQEIPEAVNYAATSGTGAAVNTNITVTSRVQLNLSCIYTTATDPNAVKCVITDSEGKVLAEIAATNKAGIMFSAIYEDVGAKQMRDVINATFYEGETAISQTVSWSVESYVAQVRAKTNVAEDELNMVNAMLTYGDAVAAYMEAK